MDIDKNEPNINKKELPFDSLFIITEMLEKIGFENMIDKLESNLQRMEDEGQKKIKNSNKEEKEKEKLIQNLKKEKQTYLGKEGLKYIILKPHKIKKEIYQLVSLYTDIEIEKIGKQPLSWVIETFKSLFMSGIWDVIKEASGGKLDSLKKTLL